MKLNAPQSATHPITTRQERVALPNPAVYTYHHGDRPAKIDADFPGGGLVTYDCSVNTAGRDGL